MSYKNKEYSIVIHAETNESFESILKQAQDKAENFIEYDQKEDGSDWKLNLDHISSEYGGRGYGSPSWFAKYEFTLHYRIYVSEPIRSIRGREITHVVIDDPIADIDVEVTDEQRKRANARLVEVTSQLKAINKKKG